MAESKDRLTWVKVLAASTVALTICCAVLAYQLTRRNSRLDDLEDQSDRIETAISRTEAETNRIGDIADDFADGDPDQSAALQEIFRKIDAIYQATVPGADEQEDS